MEKHKKKMKAIVNITKSKSTEFAKIITNFSTNVVMRWDTKEEQLSNICRFILSAKTEPIASREAVAMHEVTLRIPYMIFAPGNENANQLGQRKNNEDLAFRILCKGDTQC